MGTINHPLEFSRKDAIQTLGFPPRTIEASIKKLVELIRLKRIGSIGQGRGAQYKIISNKL